MTEVNTIRFNVVTNIERYARAHAYFVRAIAHLEHASQDVFSRDQGMHSAILHDAPEIDALITLARAKSERLRSRLYEMCEQLGRLTARSVIVPRARASEQPIVWITGNSMMPPLREVEFSERIWNLDAGNDAANATAWEVYAQAVDHELGTLNVSMDAPEHDNALYVVDTSRWVRKDDDEDTGDDMNDEWRRA